MIDRLEFKVVILGEGSVGKSTLVHRFANPNASRADLPQKATIQASYTTRRLRIPHSLDSINTSPTTTTLTIPVTLHIWDTAGQERYHALSPIYYRNANGALLVYDVCDAASFKRVKHWLNELESLLSHVPVLIVGNKVDLVQSGRMERAISDDELNSYLTELKALRLDDASKDPSGLDKTRVVYVETSAVEGLNVDMTFTFLSRWMHRLRIHNSNNNSNNQRTNTRGKLMISAESSRESLQLADGGTTRQQKSSCCK